MEKVEGRLVELGVPGITVTKVKGYGEYLNLWARGSCMTDGLRSGEERECRRKVEELVAVFGRYRPIREQGPWEHGAESCTSRPNITTIDGSPAHRPAPTRSAE